MCELTSNRSVYNRGSELGVFTPSVLLCFFFKYQQHITCAGEGGEGGCAREGGGGGCAGEVGGCAGEGGEGG